MTRVPAPHDPPISLTIAGSDSGGGAGIQADLKTMEANGCFGTSVVTSITAQNTLGVESSFVVPTEEIAAQYEAVVSDFAVAAVKTGMLAEAPVVDLVADRVRSLDVPLVVDPVMVAASGDRLLAPEAESAYERLVAEANVVTPNADEAEVLTGIEPTDPPSAIEAGRDLVDRGAGAALIKGGHIAGDTVVDTLVTPEEVTTYEHPRVSTDATHGSGCTLSSAIAARLAYGDSLETAVASGIAFMERAVRYPLAVGTGPGAVHHLVGLRERADRHPTAEATESVVRTLVEADAARLVPEVGMNVVGATRYAEDPQEVAAVEGRVTRTMAGIRPNRGVRFGASSHVARFLLTCREHDPALRFATNCRFDDTVAAALEAVDWPAVAFDRSVEPAESREEEGGTMSFAARRAFERADGTPAAVYDHGDVGKEPVVRVVAPDAGTLEARALDLLGAVREREE